MAKVPSFTVLPQRYEPGRGWQTCPVHRAQQWGVARPDGLIIARYATKRMAEQVAGTETKRALGPIRSYKLGKRMALRAPIFNDASLDDDHDYLRSL